MSRTSRLTPRIDARWLAGLTVAALLAGGLFHILHARQSSRIAGTFLQHAKRAQAEERPDDALRHLRNHVALAPKHVEGLNLYASQLADADLAESAYAYYEKSLRLAPDQWDIRRALLELAMKSQRYDDAEYHLSPLLQQFPADGACWRWKGACHTAQSEFDEGIKAFSTAIDCEPGDLESYQLLADVWQTKLKNPEQAWSCLDKMVANNPTNAHAYLTRALWRIESWNQLSTEVTYSVDAATKASQLTLLKADLHQAQELAPEAAEVLIAAGQCAILERKSEDARDVIARGLKLHPAESRFYLLLAEMETLTSNPAAALKALERGIAAVPDDIQLRWNLVNLQIELGQNDDAAVSLQWLQSAQQPSYLVEFLEAKIWIQEGRWLDAIQRLEKIRSLLQAQPELLLQTDLLLARAYGEIDAWDQRLTCLRRAVDLDPTWIAARLGLADSLLHANANRQAADEFRRILTFADAPTTAWIQLARCLFRLNLSQPAPLQDWTEFQQALAKAAQDESSAVAAVILRADQLVAVGEEVQAQQLLSQAKATRIDRLDYWMAQIKLAVMEHRWDEADGLLWDALQRFGDHPALRGLQAHCWLHRLGPAAREPLQKLTEPLPAAWSNDERFRFLHDFSLIFLDLGAFEESRRLGLAALDMRPRDLSLRQSLFDIAFQSRDLDLLEQAIADVRTLTDDGPMWHYGEALRFTLQAMQAPQTESHLASARRHLAHARAQRPGWTRIPLLLAEIETLHGQPAAATEALQDAVSLGERNPTVIQRLVAVLFSQRRFIEADQMIRRLSERDAALDSEVARTASQIAMELSDPARAVEMAEHLVHQHETDQNRIWLCQVLSAVGRFDDAEQELRKVLAREPASPSAWTALVQLLARQNQFDRAEQVIVEAEAAIAARQATLVIAQCYEQIGRLDQAEVKYRQALAESPDDTAVLHLGIEFQIRHHRLRNAEALLEQLHQHAGDATERSWAARQWAALLAMQDDPTASQRALELIEQDSTDHLRSPSDQRLKAQILAKMPGLSRQQQAMELLEQLLASGVEATPDDRHLLAQLYSAVGDQRKCRKEYRQLLALQPNEARFLTSYLQELLAAGEVAEASRWLNRLQTLAPANLPTVEIEAQLLFQRQQYEDMATLLLAASETDETSSEYTSLSTDRQLWAAQQFEKYSRKLRDRGQFQRSQEFAAQAERCYVIDISQRPEHVLNLAAFAARLDQIDRALTLLAEHASVSHPDQIATASQLIIASPVTTDVQLGQLTDLLAVACSHHRDSAAIQLALGDLLSWRGKFEDAIQHYRWALQIDGQNVSALNNLALLLARNPRDCDEALRLLERAFEAVGESDYLLDSRGVIYLAAGTPQQALAEFERSLQTQKSPERYLHQAAACLELRQTEAAKRAFQKAMEAGLDDGKLHPIEREFHAKIRSVLFPG